MNLTFLRRRLARAILLGLVVASVGGVARAAKPTYPPAKKGAVVQDYGAVKVADPYRWLEDAADPETVRWVDAENALTRSYLDGPRRDAIKARLTTLLDFPRVRPIANGRPIEHRHTLLPRLH